MHSSKRVDQPQNYSIKLPRWQDRCPKCGKPKSKSSKRCAECRTEHEKARYVNYFWSGRVKMDYCPFCGKVKTAHSPQCNRCKIERKRTKVSKMIFYVEGEPCRWIGLTQGQKTIVDAALYTELVQWDWHAFWAEGSHSYYAHRTGMPMHHHIAGAPKKGMEVDHKNHDTLDHRRSNLRHGTPQQNRWNSRRQGGKYSRYKGTSWDKRHKIWRVRICVQGRNISLGYRSDPIEAAKVYDTAAMKYFGEFAHLNFP